MPRDNSGIYTLPGVAFSPGLPIYSSEVNAKFGDIQDALTNSLSRSNLGWMQAPLRLADGSAAEPSLTFQGATNLGMYLSAADAFRVVSASSPLQEWKATGVTFYPAVTVDDSLTVTGGVTVTTSTTNGSAVTGTGNGSGFGGLFTGGTTNGGGVRGVGIGTGAGATFTGGTSGKGLTATAGGGNTSGATITGTGSGAGVEATGGPTDGRGLTATGGGGNSVGVFTTGTGTAAGIEATGGTTNGPGGRFSAGAGSGTLGRTIAIQAVNGDISLDGVTNPSNVVAMKNVLTPKNIIKAWVNLQTSGTAAAPTITDGFNVLSAAVATTTLTVTFATGGGMGDTNYSVFITGQDGDLNFFVTTRATGSVSIQATQTTGTSAGTVTRNSYNFAANIARIHILCVGAQ